MIRNATLAVLLLLTLAVPAPNAQAQAQDDASVVNELRQLRQSLTELMGLWQRQAWVDERSVLLRDVDLMDRNLSFLRGERTELAAERLELSTEIAQAGELEQRLDEAPDSDFAEMMLSMAEQKLETVRAAAALKQQRLAEIERRLDELDGDIERRQAQRAALEQELDAMLPAG